MKDGIFIQKGDLIIFNDKHMLYCGDATQKESYSFMDGENVAMCFTSPPYNVGRNNCENVGDKVKENGKYQTRESDIKNDNEYMDLIDKSLNYSLDHCEYVFYNIAHLSGNKISLIEWLNKNRYKFVDTMIWKKATSLPALEPRVLNTDFEYVYIFTNKENNGRHIKIGPEFQGTKSNVFEIKRNTQNRFSQIHSALMPMDLCDYIITNFTNENDIVLDCFSGLGTNMISCNNNNRYYRGIELEPFDCQETIKRFIDSCSDYDIQIIRNGEIIPFDDFKEYILENSNQLF